MFHVIMYVIKCCAISKFKFHRCKTSNNQCMYGWIKWWIRWMQTGKGRIMDKNWHTDISRQTGQTKRHIDTHHSNYNNYQNARTTLTTLLNCWNRHGCLVFFEENWYSKRYQTRDSSTSTSTASSLVPNNFWVITANQRNRYFRNRFGSYNQYVKIVIGTIINSHKRTSVHAFFAKFHR